MITLRGLIGALLTILTWPLWVPLLILSFFEQARRDEEEEGRRRAAALERALHEEGLLLPDGRTARRLPDGSLIVEGGGGDGDVP